MSPFLAFLSGVVAAVLGLFLARRKFGFAAQRPADYADGAPAFDIRREFAGPLRCQGVIYGPLGRVESRFAADMNGRWDGDTCQLAEEFRYASGATQSRCWTLHLAADGSIRAEAPDVVGTGTGRQHGSAVHLRYRIRLPADSGGHVLSVTDWMYLAPDGSIVNRSQFRKFGIKVAELVATMHRPAL